MFYFRALTLLAALTTALPTISAANPQDISCRMLDAMSNNRAAELNPMLEEVGSRWVPQSREGASEQLTKLLEAEPFVGGSLFRIAKLGDDFEEHIMLLRLGVGEVAGMRLRYEWTPDGLTLTGIDFKRQIGELSTVSFIGAPEEITC